MLNVNGKNSFFYRFEEFDFNRIMLIKNGEYNSLWQLVGDLKIKESKIIPLPPRPRQSIPDSITPIKALSSKTPEENIPSPEIKLPEPQETLQSLINNLSGDYHQENLTMAAIEDHQKRHTFAPNLQQAQENYRELRRLLKKFNGPILKENKIKKIS